MRRDNGKIELRLGDVIVRPSGFWQLVETEPVAWFDAHGFVAGGYEAVRTDEAQALKQFKSGSVVLDLVSSSPGVWG